MFNISSYLEKFKKMEPEGELAKRTAQNAILETLGVNIPNTDANVRDGVLHISAPAAVKSEIFMNKRGILKKTRETSGVRAIKDIR